ncbi:hypothetical protein CUS55_07400 [Enterococcus faecium]|nr:hypothetical protein CUS55_07400 [Enterococcus faecium]
MCCGNSILQKGLPFFYLHKIFYTLKMICREKAIHEIKHLLHEVDKYDKYDKYDEKEMGKFEKTFDFM